MYRKKKTGCERVEWINLAQDIKQWLTFWIR